MVRLEGKRRGHIALRPAMPTMGAEILPGGFSVYISLCLLTKIVGRTCRHRWRQFLTLEVRCSKVCGLASRRYARAITQKSERDRKNIITLRAAVFAIFVQAIMGGFISGMLCMPVGFPNRRRVWDIALTAIVSAKAGLARKVVVV